MDAKVRQEMARWAYEILARHQALLLDVESTGVHSTDEVIQVAVMDLDGLLLYQSLVCAEKPCNAEAAAVHGLGPELLALADPWPVIAAEVAPLLYGRDIIAYNAPFDRRLIAQSCARYGCPPLDEAPSEWIDALPPYTAWYGQRGRSGEYKRQKLPCFLVDELGQRLGDHDAGDDCRNLALLLREMAGVLDEEEKEERWQTGK